MERTIQVTGRGTVRRAPDSVRLTLAVSAKDADYARATERAEAVVSLKADKQTPMGVVADVKKALRKAGALRVRYFVVGSE